MNQKIKIFLVTAALLGFSAGARAADPAPVPASGKMGLLGQTYAGLTYTYLNLDRSPANADGFSFEMNKSLQTGLDGLLTYDWTQSGRVAGSRLNQQTLGAAVRAFNPTLPWGQPYVEAGAASPGQNSPGRMTTRLSGSWPLARSFKPPPRSP